MHITMMRMNQHSIWLIQPEIKSRHTSVDVLADAASAANVARALQAV